MTPTEGALRLVIILIGCVCFCWFMVYEVLAWTSRVKRDAAPEEEDEDP